MNAKLNVNLNTGTLEVEASEEFVREIYKEFKELLQTSKSISPSEVIGSQDVNLNTSNKKRETKQKNTKNKGTSSSKTPDDIKYLSNLNLMPKNKISLKDYISQYKDVTNEEKYLLIIYYLINTIEENKITPNHIFTCLRELKMRIPSYLKQVLTNIKNSKNWIETSNWEEIKYTTAGMNHVEHDMEKRKLNGK